jgi:hypothetical protein
MGSSEDGINIMPRITNLTFTKDYETVADGLASMLENAAIAPPREYAGRALIEVEGDFGPVLVLEDMDAWEGHIKFEVQDNQAVSEEEMQAKGSLATALPELAHTLYSPTIAKVYRRIEVVTRITTITERLVDGITKNRDEIVETSEVQYEWEDVTLKFGKIMDERMGKLKW